MLRCEHDQHCRSTDLTDDKNNEVEEEDDDCESTRKKKINGMIERNEKTKKPD